MKQPRTLAEYFKQPGAGTHVALARRLKVSKAFVSMIVSGERQPSITLAVKIEQETGVTLPVLRAVRALVKVA